MSGDLRLLGGGSEDEPFEDLQTVDLASAGQARARRTGNEFVEHALEYVQSAGASITSYVSRVAGLAIVDAVIVGPNSRPYWLIAHGTIDDGPRAGLKRTDTVLKTIGAAHLVTRQIGANPIVVVTSHLPTVASASANQLAGARDLFWDVVATTADLAGFQRLCAHLQDPCPQRPDNAPWMFGTPPGKGGLVGQLTFEQGEEDA